MAKLAGRPRLPGRRSTTSARSSQFSFPACPPSSFSTVSCSPAPSSPSALLRRHRERPRVSQLVCATPPPPGTSVCSQLVCGAPPPPGTSARIPAPRSFSSSPVTPSRLRGAKLEYVIGRSDEDLKTPFGIKILDKLTQTWVVPTVVGA